jgi:hypothetical protein
VTGGDTIPPRPPSPRDPVPARGSAAAQAGRRSPKLLWILLIVVLALGGLDAWVLQRRAMYETEIHRLRGRMTDVERQRTDALLSSRNERGQMMMEIVRRRARWGKDIHLAVSVDSGRMYLERQGAVLRTMPVMLGAARRIGRRPDTVEVAVPRGMRTVQAVLGPSDAWEVPRWVYADRHLSAPASAQQRTFKQALGPVAIVLDGGTVIYSLPTAGPLNDSSYTMPGSVRARAQDLDAIAENITKGTVVYFY